MKIRNNLFENSQYLETIVKIHKSDQLGVMDAYRINRLVKKLDELNTEYNELKGKILNQFGTPDSAEGQEGRYSIPPESIEEFNKEFSELINIEHDLETDLLPFPTKLEDGFSSADLGVMELFFDMSNLDNPKSEEN